MKRIGVLTSGGDSPGMNAAIRTIVRATLHRGMEPWAIYRGFLGLVRGEMEPLGSRAVSGIIQRGGTVLKSARCDEFKGKDGQRQARQTLAEKGIDAVIVIGGNGSLQGALALEQMGLDVVFIPATIDNDVPCTEGAIGFDTAANTVIDAVNKIRDTASSHERVYVVEVMGRDSGALAMYSGLASGADVILIPEVAYDVDKVCERIITANQQGKTYNIVMVAEGIEPLEGEKDQDSPSLQIGHYLQAKTGYDVRITILGHIQRGGAPTVKDRLLASRLAYNAVELLAQGQSGKMLGEVNHEVESFDLAYAVRQKKPLNLDYYHLAEILASI